MHHNPKQNKNTPERKQIQLAKISHGFEYYDKTFIYNNKLQNKKWQTSTGSHAIIILDNKVCS